MKEREDVPGESSPFRFITKDAEVHRLIDAGRNNVPWRRWGPYLSERQWGTVREDYSIDGNAWNYFTHDQARSRAYRWGEDGLAGISDDKQRLCFALALWNGKDPILKERLFGLTNAEGNHGEDVKEYYFYLDNTPTHSYMKYLYKYPQAPYPYDDLVSTNMARSRKDLEYELLDTGVFDEDRYWDVFVEYAKESPDDMLIRITAANRGPDRATLHILPTLWFRNTWSWDQDNEKPRMVLLAKGIPGMSVISLQDTILGNRWFYADGDGAVLFTENETNNERIFGTPNAGPYVKDGFHRYIVSGEKGAVNPAGEGTKAVVHYRLNVEGGRTAVVLLRMANTGPGETEMASHDGRRRFAVQCDEVFSRRRQEADQFYDAITPDGLTAEERNVMRQALAGMLWTKQYYSFDLNRWLAEHKAHPLVSTKRSSVRNRNWYHMVNDDVISMPDKWEYPWYAAWDLAFHTGALNMVDPRFARDQLDLMLSEVYLHPNGQIPAYEWNFGDVNPPVHAWATLFAYSVENQLTSGGSAEYLKQAFKKLLMNFTWWVNRKDANGSNVFEGGFLGLDNIGVFDRSAQLPTGGTLEQADGTAWMALYSQNMLELALEIALHDSTYEDMASKFLEHFLWIAAAMDRSGEHKDELWDEEDGFFYDILRMPDGHATRIKVRSMVGLLPLCAVTVISREITDRFPRFMEKAVRFMERHAGLLENIHPPQETGFAGRHLLSVLTEEKLRRVLGRMLDEERFFSPYGVRSLSRWHKDHPYVFQVHGEEYRVEYLPAESDSGMFGGNSNWRGPVWFPVNLLVIRALLQYYLYYGDSFTIECPTGSGKRINLFNVAREIARRLTAIFLRDGSGRRPVYGGATKFQTDPHWRDHILFYEYFHGDNGAGLGASHQTGWTGTVARLIQLFGFLDEKEVLESGTRPITRIFLKGLEGQ